MLIWLLMVCCLAKEAVELRVPVDVGGQTRNLELRRGDEVCAALVEFCASSSSRCVRELALAVAPLVHERWSGSLELSDAYFCGCSLLCADLGDPSKTTTTALEVELLGFLRGAITARDSRSPLLARYNALRTRLPQGDRLAHYGAVLRLIPNNPAALDGLAVALRAARRDDEADAALAFGTSLGYWPSEMQRPSSHVSNLRARPWWPTTPALKELLNNTFIETAQRELLQEMARHDSCVVQQAEGLVNDTSWEEIVLFKHGILATCASRFPLTVARVFSNEFFNAKFSILQPRSRILPHCGPSNVRLRAHVVIAAAVNATLRVGGEPPREWRDGEAIVFDDSFEHEVVHDGDSPRIVLILDLWHHDLPVDQRDFHKHGMQLS